MLWKRTGPKHENPDPQEEPVFTRLRDPVTVSEFSTSAAFLLTLPLVTRSSGTSGVAGSDALFRLERRRVFPSSLEAW